MKKNLLLAILPPFWPKLPPLGILYIQSFLAKMGIDSDLLDLNNIFYNLAPGKLKESWNVSCNNQLEENILSIIKEYSGEKYASIVEEMLKYEAIGFSCFKSNFKATLEIAKTLKSKNPDIKIILGGPEILRQYFKTSGEFTEEIKTLSDLSVVGEGELGIFNYLTGKSQNGKVTKFCEVDNLDKIPFPRYNTISLGDYPKKNALPLLFSRGCVKRCSFCSERLLYKNFRTRSVDSTLKEIDYNRSNNRVSSFIFHDSMINSDLKKLETLCDEIIASFTSIHWEAQIYIRKDMPQTLLRKMKKSGCYNLFIGLESGCKNTLSRMNKGFTPEDALFVFKSLNEAGLNFGVSIIVGYPGETESDFKESLDFLVEHKSLIPKIEQVNPFTYYDGTDTEKPSDYPADEERFTRFKEFTSQIKRHNFRYTNAFLGNLMEK